MAQAGNVFACRTERLSGRRLGWFSNRFLWIGVLVEIAIILALIYIPILARIFDHVPLPWQYWLVLGLYGPILYALDRTRKVLVNRREARKRARKQ